MDSWWLATFFLLEALAHGAQLQRQCRIVSGSRGPDGMWHLLAEPRQELRARVVINCAGLFADQVEAIRCQLRGDAAPFTILPRRGQFLVFAPPPGPAAAPLIHRIIYPVPSPVTKGILLTPTLRGPLFVGPTAQTQTSRTDRSVDPAVSQQLLDAARRLCPALASWPVCLEYVGLRPATQFTDYQLAAHPDQAWITVGGIRSTGATGSLGIAQYVLLQFLPRFFPAAALTAGPSAQEPQRRVTTLTLARNLATAIDHHRHDLTRAIPVALPNHGHLDVVVTHPLSRVGLAKL
jgi:glycerol-3-phosphate dehydrogenase